MTAQVSPEVPEELAGAVAVLAAHQFDAEDGSCSCNEMFYDTRRPADLVLVEHFLHVGMELHLAGVGDMAAAADKARKDAAEGLRSWYEERIDKDFSLAVEVPEYDAGREVGVTEGILAAALSVHADGGRPRSDEARAEARATIRAERRRRRKANAAQATQGAPEVTYPPDPQWGTDPRGKFRYTDYDGEALLIWRDAEDGFWVDKQGEGPVYVREQDSPIITEQLTTPKRSPHGNDD